MKYEKELETALGLATKAGNLALKHHGSNVQYELKSDNTKVSFVDKECDKIITSGLKQNFPLDSIVSEEFGLVDANARRTWYVDPIDGTNSYLRGEPDFAVHIGLCENGAPIVGVVHRPVTMETYFGVVGHGGFKFDRDGKDTNLAYFPKATRLIVSTSKDNDDYKDNKELYDALKVTHFLRTGSSGLRIVAIAEGNSSFMVATKKGSVWDFCAPQAILEASGGVAAYLASNEPIVYGTKPKLAGPVVFANTAQTLEFVKDTYERIK